MREKQRESEEERESKSDRVEESDKQRASVRLRERETGWNWGREIEKEEGRDIERYVDIDIRNETKSNTKEMKTREY